MFINKLRLEYHPADVVVKEIDTGLADAALLTAALNIASRQNLPSAQAHQVTRWMIDANGMEILRWITARFTNQCDPPVYTVASLTAITRFAESKGYGSVEIRIANEK